MRTRLETLTVSTTAPTELVDITAEVRSLTASSGVLNGVLTLISRHTTAYVNLNESEAELQKDMVMYLDRLVPRDDDYGHNRAPVDDRPNAHAHLLGLFMNASESIPIVDGELLLGGWQSIFLVELDGPRDTRQITLHFIGVT
jgi:secondary thiamine-phosphate synthase enzyme